MGVNPVLVVKLKEGNIIRVRARLRDDFVEHEIVLNSLLTYYWSNNLPPVAKFVELFESVIKRTINELMPHKNLYLTYNIKADNNLEEASRLKITLIEVMADDIGFKFDGHEIALSGFRQVDEDNQDNLFEETYEKTIETPEIVLKKYLEMKEKKS